MIRAWQYRGGVERIDVPFDPLSLIDPSALIKQKIAAWGATLLIATLVTGVLGMNFQNAPNVGWRVGFLMIGLIDIALSLPLYLCFKRKRWL